MNAQEAIDIVEDLLTEFREESENGLTLESEKEALSIVLESAKVFHKHVIPRMELQYERELQYKRKGGEVK